MQKLTPEDLQFLIYNKVALRFQHLTHDKKFQKEGSINGDAYSLSYPQIWYPPNEAKAMEFERELKEKIHGIFISEMASRDNYDGALLLFKDVEGARLPVTEKGSYKPPFYPVGAGTTFRKQQCIGRVDLSRNLIETQLGFNRNTSGPADGERVVDHITDAVIGQIIHARQQSPDQSAAIAADAGRLQIIHKRRHIERDRDGGNWQSPG